MSKKIRKTPPEQVKKEWHPSAAVLAQSLKRAADFGKDAVPMILDLNQPDEIAGTLGAYRPLTAGEITKGKRYLAREERRAAYEIERAENLRKAAEAEERRLERQRERNALAARRKESAHKLASARAAVTKMVGS